LGLAVAIALLAPIYPLLGILTVYRWNPHYLLVPGLAFFALAGWAARQCLDRVAASTPADAATASRSGSRIEIALWAVVCVLTITQIHSAWKAAWPWSKDDHIARYRVEGEHELYATERSLIVDAIGPPWHHHGLRGIRAQLLALPEGPVACAGRDCVDAAQRQRDRGGTCVRYFGDPPRLARVACTMPAESGERSPRN
jgi:hypothetical protein